MGRRKSFSINCSSANNNNNNNGSSNSKQLGPGIYTIEQDIQNPRNNNKSLGNCSKANVKCNNKNEGVRLRKEIGLLEAVALIIGAIIGSGIFVTPKGVFEIMNSVGGSLTVWLICGLVSMSGAMCFLELGTTMPKSGSSYYYLLEVLGPMIAFLYLWAQVLIFIPAGNAIFGLSFANYVVQIFFPSGCHLPEASLKLIAASTILFLVFLNCYNIRGLTRLQNVLMFTKISPLIFIIVVGIYAFIRNDIENLAHPFDSTNYNAGNLSLAFYSGFFAYGGWSVLNCVTEEIKNPNKNMPRAIYISLPIVTIIYIMANIGYFVVLSPAEIISADAIAATFAKKILSPYWSFLMPCFVAFSTFGGLSIHIMSSSRQLFVGARHGQFPSILAQINVTKLTPDTALIFLGILSLFYLITSDIYALITYTSYIHNVTSVAVIIVIFMIRRDSSNYERPVQVSIIHPIIFSIATVFLTIFPMIASPIEACTGLLIGVSGLPIYYLLLKNGPDKKSRPPVWLKQRIDQACVIIQKIFLCVPED